MWGNMNFSKNKTSYPSRFIQSCFSLFAIVVLISTFCSPTAASDFPGREVIFYAEPLLGIGAASVEARQGLLANNSASDDGYLPYLGVNVGWQVDYVHLITHFKYGQYLGDTFTDGSYREFGLGVGWEWNIPLITTILFKFGGSAEVGNAKSTSGGGLEVSLGYFVSEDIKASLVYSSTSFGSDEDNTSVDMDFVGVSVSFPFELGYPSEWWRKDL